MMAEAGEGRQPRSGGQAGLRARKKARTRAAIEDAALRLFLERGYAATTIDEIAAAVEVSPRTVLRYFASKEEVLFSRERETVRTLGALLAARSPQEPLLLAARAALTQLAAAYDATRERRLSWAHLVRGTPALAGAYLELLAGFEDAVAGFAAGHSSLQERQGVRPRLQAALIVAAFRVALERWEGADGDLAQLVAEHLDLLDSDLWQ
jgi:AcrR family transcriptional regulator